MMDFDKYTIKLNVKGICYFEKMTGKTFFKMGLEDVIMLAYSCFIVNNPREIVTYETFQTLLKNKKVSQWIFGGIEKELEHIMEFSGRAITGDDVVEDAYAPEMKMSDIASALIVKVGLDPHYVMYEMDVWEMEMYFTQWDMDKKEKLIDKRFWTYLQVAPQIDSKKIKSPEDLVPFTWEAEDKKRRMDEDLKNNEYAVKTTIGRSIEDILGNKDGTERI